MMQKYLMNEVMEEQGVTRETLKYYEKLGLIEPERTDKGYRQYNEITMYKIKLIKDMKDVGFEYKEIEELFNNFFVRNCMNIFSKRIEEIQTEIKQLKILLNELYLFRKSTVDWTFYSENFQLIKGIVFCTKWCEEEIGKVYSHNVHNVQLYHFDEECNVKKGDCLKKVLLMVQNEYCDVCANCTERIEVDQVWRGTVKFKNEEQFQEKLKEIYAKGKLLDYELGNEIMCLKAYYKEVNNDEIEEGIAVDIYIPLKNRY